MTLPPSPPPLVQDSPLAAYLHGPLARQLAKVREQLLGAPQELKAQLEAAIDLFYERMQELPELLGLDLGPKSGRLPGAPRIGLAVASALCWPSGRLAAGLPAARHASGAVLCLR